MISPQTQSTQRKTHTVASIDIGTNTILLLVAKIDQGQLKPLLEIETIVRLGEGLQKSGVLSEEVMKIGIRALNQYVDHCRAFGVEEIFAVGTSALREAKNSGDFLRVVRENFNLSIEIISGEEEAHLSYLAVAEDLKGVDKPILVVDVGGGSTEIIRGKGEQINHWISLPMGSVRFTEQFLLSDPVQEGEWNDMVERIQAVLSRLPEIDEPVMLVAVGGTATTLASVEQQLERFVPERIHHFVLTRQALGNQLSLFKAKTLDERRRIPGLPPARADVILAGGAILYLAMEKLKCPSALISCHGIRYGLLYDRFSLG